VLLSPVPRLRKLHRLVTREERGTQDRGPRVHQAHQQGAVRPMEALKIPTPEGYSITEPFQIRRACCCPQTPEARKISGSGFHLPVVYTPRRVSPQILVLRFPHFLLAPTQNSKDLEKSTNSCGP